MSQFMPPKRAGPSPEELTRVCSRMSGLAVTSLACGILGLFTCGITGLIGLLLGTIALVVINKSGGELRGHALAVSGIVVSGVGVMILVGFGALAAIAYPGFVDATQEAMNSNVRSQVQIIRSQIELYNGMHPESAYDARTPVTGFWAPLLREDLLLSAPRNLLQKNSTAVARAPAVNVGWVWAALDPSDPETFNIYAVNAEGDDVLCDDEPYGSGEPW